MSTSRSVGSSDRSRENASSSAAWFLCGQPRAGYRSMFWRRPRFGSNSRRVDAERRDHDPLGLDAERRHDSGLRELADRDDDIGAAGRIVVEPSPVGALGAAELVGQVDVLDVEEGDDDGRRRGGAGHRDRERIVDDVGARPGGAHWIAGELPPQRSL